MEKDEGYIKANARQRAILGDDDLWAAHVLEEIGAAADFINLRLTKAPLPMAVLPGFVGAAGQLAGMGALQDGQEQVLNDMHQILEAFCDRARHAPIDDYARDHRWREQTFPEHKVAVRYFESRITTKNPPSAPFAVLCGIMGAADVIAGSVVKVGAEQAIINDLHNILEALFRGGIEMNDELHNAIDMRRTAKIQ